MFDYVRGRFRAFGSESGKESSPTGGVESEIALWSSEDAVTWSDFSYNDALFDLQLREALQFEYSSAEPPPGVFERMAGAPTAPKTLRPKELRQILSPLAAILISLKHALGGPVTSRLVPGAVALAIVLSYHGAPAQILGGGAIVDFSPLAESSTSSREIYARAEERPALALASTLSAGVQIEQDDAYYLTGAWRRSSVTERRAETGAGAQSPSSGTATSKRGFVLSR